VGWSFFSLTSNPSHWTCASRIHGPSRAHDYFSLRGCNGITSGTGDWWRFPMRDLHSMREQMRCGNQTIFVGLDSHQWKAFAHSLLNCS